MSDNEISVNIGGADIESASELDGCKVVFTGRLTEATRADVKELVESVGGIPRAIYDATEYFASSEETNTGDLFRTFISEGLQSRIDKNSIRDSWPTR